ncbi:ABC transporter substrate-binding protein [Paenibacillus qinlingensis]|uniref:ABC-type glycerol-3-phosphate transport system substrate-binding protein n=1 Tax=Paenibacillus qinlingensis TaxID=1837343 RepID=A0ABU1NUF2_9BACL|nr:ABC transporter substrate-binding protein [Paenibacillus qinlingensis]MDR6550622.1 ABC-type glycerol-3-phosphate transport system substrate-binding protein [Paenibacillus qinlingensis]
MKICARLLPIGVSLLLLTACESQISTTIPKPTPKEQTLTWVHHFDEEGARKWLEAGTQLFDKKYPAYSFALTGVDAGNYMSLLRSKAVSNTMPDIYMVDSISAAKDLIQSGYALDLTGQPFLSQIDERYLQGVKSSDGKIWALPIDVNGVGVIYNKDAFAKAGILNPPSTWSEFLLDCRKLENAGITPIAAGYKDSWTILWDVAADLLVSQYAFEPNWITNVEAGRTTFKEDHIHFENVLKRYEERLAYVNSKPFETDWNQALDMLADGKAGMIINGTWTVDGVKSKNPSSNLGLFAFPYSEHQEDAKFPLKSTGGIVINPKSPHKEAALQALDIFASKEMGLNFQTNKKALSVIKGLPTDFDPTYVELDKAYIQTSKVYDWSKMTTDFVNQDLQKIYVDALTRFALDKNRNTDVFLSELDQAFDRIRKPVK